MELRFEEGPFAGKRRSSKDDGTFPKVFLRVGKDEDLYYLRRRIITVFKGVHMVAGLVYAYVKDTESCPPNTQKKQ